MGRKRSGMRGGNVEWEGEEEEGSRVIGWNMTAAHSTFIPSHILRPV